MYTDMEEALAASERLRMRHCADADIARGIVAVWAGYQDWADLKRRVGTSDTTEPAEVDHEAEDADDEFITMGMDYAPTLRSYMEDHGNPLIDGIDWKIMPSQLDSLLKPDEYPLADEVMRDQVMEAAHRVLASSPHVPAWLRIDEVRMKPDGGFTMRAVTRHRDGVREAFVALDSNDVEDEDEDQHQHDDTVFKAEALARNYAADHLGDSKQPPVDAGDVAYGLADHHYGVDVPTLRWAIERWGGEARSMLRAHVIRRQGDRDGHPDHDTSSYVDLNEPEPGEEDHYPRIERYGVHLVDGVLRRAMRLGPGVIWDRAVHTTTQLPQTTAMAIMGRGVEALVEHPYLAGATIAAIHNGPGQTVVELEQHLVALDSAGPDETAWRPFKPLAAEREESGATLVDWDIYIAQDITGRIVDSTLVRGTYYGLCESHGRKSIVIATKTGKVFSDEDGPFATECPRRILDKADPATGEMAFSWRLRCMGLSDRADGNTVYF